MQAGEICAFLRLIRAAYIPKNTDRFLFIHLSRRCDCQSPRPSYYQGNTLYSEVGNELPRHMGVEVLPRMANVEVTALLCSIDVNLFAVLVFAIIYVVTLEIRHKDV